MTIINQEIILTDGSRLLKKKKKTKYLLILVSFVQEQSKVNISPTLEHCSSAQSEFPFLSIVL